MPNLFLKIHIYIVVAVLALTSTVWAESDIENCRQKYEEKDYNAAYPLCLKAAEQGDAEAQFNLGLLYHDDKKLRKDETQIYEWIKKSADQGYLAAQGALGRLYSDGIGVKLDDKEAVKWYRMAANKGHSLAQAELGWMYLLGRGVPKNYKEAVKYFIMSAEQGDYWGQEQLAGVYRSGQGVSRDLVLALAWYSLAAIHSKDALEVRDKLESELPPSQIKKSQQLAAQFQHEIEQRNNLKKVPNKDTLSSAKVIIHPILTTPEISKPAFFANDIAIIIGIEKYRSVPPTEYAVADAEMVRDYLKALGIPERNIEFLADDRATLSDIRKVIETKLPNMVKANSRVIVYYAGHGAPGTARGESYLVPYDGDPSFLADTAYPLSRLYDRLSRLNAKEVLVILDSCFSGAGGRSVLAKNTRPLVMVKDTPPPASKKMIVITSSRGSQITTSLSEVGHGAFTYFFLRALQEGNRDIGEVYAYLNPRVTEEAKRQNVDQTPTISPTADKLKGRFLFAR